MQERASGILLPIPCLPSPFGIGDVGPSARRFVDFLVAAGQRYFQVLPIHKTRPEGQHNPYSTSSAFAGDPLLISPSDLVAQGLVKRESLRDVAAFPEGRIDYERVSQLKQRLLDEAYSTHQRRGPSDELARFARRHAAWLDTHTLFAALKAQHGGAPFRSWPRELRDREPHALDHARHELREEIARETFVQFLFFSQWETLKRYATRRGVALLGDLPIYLDLESAEVWAEPHLFQLDEDLRPRFLSGAPPDQFSSEGQSWGHPLYDWDALEAGGFELWVRRCEHNLSLFDFTRIDHFRGLAGYWSIPRDAGSAREGHWEPAPGQALLEVLRARLGKLPFFAEDLGTITDDVRALKERFGLPGMAVLLFAFSQDLEHHPYLPHNHDPHLVVYTGTHDTQTARGFWEVEATPHEKHLLGSYVGHYIYPETVSEAFVRMALESRANTAIIPIQDWLGLGAEARINTPNQSEGNYRFRLPDHALTPELAQLIRVQTEQTGRLHSGR